jgi:siroheme synthase-like protein
MKGELAAGLKYLPVGLDIRDRRCVIVGGGGVGTRKVENLVAAHAQVTVVAPSISVDLAGYVGSGAVNWIEGPFEDRQLDGAFLVVAATDDVALNERIVRSALSRGALVCDASAAERSQVIFGALLHSAGTTVAVFTDGRDPALARRTRDRIAGLLASGQE